MIRKIRASVPIADAFMCFFMRVTFESTAPPTSSNLTRTDAVPYQARGAGEGLTATQPAAQAGRPMAARQRMDLADVWAEHGVSVLQRLAVTDPGKLAQIAYGLLPRDVFIVEQRSQRQLDPANAASAAGVTSSAKRR